MKPQTNLSKTQKNRRVGGVDDNLPLPIYDRGADNNSSTIPAHQLPINRMDVKEPTIPAPQPPGMWLLDNDKKPDMEHIENLTNTIFKHFFNSSSPF